MNRSLQRIACTLFVLATALPTAFSQDAQPAAAGLQNGGFLSSEYVPSDAVLAIYGSPKDILSASEMEMMPIEIIQAQALEEIGVDPLHIQNIKIVAGAPGPGGPPAGAVIELTQDYDISDLNQRMFLDTEPQDVGGRDVYIIDGPPGTVLYRRDARTFMIGIGGYLEAMLDADGQEGQLPQLLSMIPNKNGITAVAVMEPIRPMLTGMLKQNADQMPPQLQGLTRIPELTNAVVVNIQPRQLIDSQVMVVALCTDNAAATEMEGILNQSLDFGRDQVMQQVSSNADSDDPIKMATAKYLARVSNKFSNMLRPQRAGNRLTIRTDGNLASSGILVGLLLPAIQTTHGTVRRMTAVNSMKQLGLAMHNHHDTYKLFPDPAIRDASGKPLLSWRVKILPFIEQAALYDQFHLDEPWDSEHNIQLLDQMPQVYEHPSLRLPPGQTVFQLPVGKGLIFEGDSPAKMRDITDGTSNTIMIVEADESAAVPWTKPADVEVDLANPAASLSMLNDGGFLATIGDGSVRIVPTDDANLLKKLFTRSGGEIIGDY